MSDSTPSIDDLIRATGKTTYQIADEAGISRTLVHYCKKGNHWPKQRRPRQALQKALGVTTDQVEA